MDSAALPTPTRPRPARSLAPREHGAYGQLGVPLLAALAMGRPTSGAALLAAAAVAGFLAHEPALVHLGQRGAKAQREHGRRARVRGLQLCALALLAGGAGLALCPAARAGAGVPLVLLLALAPFVLRGEEKSTPGELLAAGALAGAALPVALAAGVPARAALSAWGAWCLALGAPVFAVRGALAHARVPVAWPRRLAGPLLAGVGLLGLGRWGWSPAAWGAAPLLLCSVALAARPPHPRSLRRVGWTLVAGSLALALTLAVCAHR